MVSEYPHRLKVDEGWEVSATRGLLGLGDGGNCRPQIVVHEHVLVYAKEDPLLFFAVSTNVF